MLALGLSVHALADLVAIGAAASAVDTFPAEGGDIEITGIYRRLDSLVRVRGTWKVELSDMGTELTYAKQKVGADAFVRGVAEGAHPDPGDECESADRQDGRTHRQQ